MNLLNQFPQVLKNFAALGQTRLLMLGGVGVLSMAIVLAAALYVNKPAYETLYVGLETMDLNKISIALAESNVDFQVGSDGTSLQVPVGMTARLACCWPNAVCLIAPMQATSFSIASAHSAAHPSCRK